MGMVLSAVGACLLFILKVVGILLLILLVLAALLLLCPFCADVCWQNDTLTVKAGALGITFPVFQYPKPEPTEESKRKKKPKKAKAAKKPAKEKKSAEPRKKAKLTLNILCTILRGAGTKRPRRAALRATARPSRHLSGKMSAGCRTTPSSWRSSATSA